MTKFNGESIVKQEEIDLKQSERVVDIENLPEAVSVEYSDFV